MVTQAPGSEKKENGYTQKRAYPYLPTRYDIRRSKSLSLAQIKQSRTLPLAAQPSLSRYIIPATTLPSPLLINSKRAKERGSPGRARRGDSRKTGKGRAERWKRDPESPMMMLSRDVCCVHVCVQVHARRAPHRKGKQPVRFYYCTDSLFRIQLLLRLSASFLVALQLQATWVRG